MANSVKAASLTKAASDKAPAEAEKADGSARVPLGFVVDGDASIRSFLSLVLHGVGIDTEEFADGETFRLALSHRTPDIVFLNIALESAEALECVMALGMRAYAGYVQLMSNRGSAVLQHVKSIGQQQRLQMVAPLKKPLDTSVLLKVLHDLKLGHPQSLAARVDLEEALRLDWIEFWYQPKIDLRRKQLIGTEAFARARHPQYGILTPNAFMPGASESSLITLSELALERALKAGVNFANLGVTLRPAVNIPVEALVKMPVEDIVQTYRGKFEKWPGLTVDIAEEQIIDALPLASELAKKLRHLNIHLAIDHFGRGYSALARLKESPFAEFKLDRAFVNDCASDKVNAPLCKTAIDLAHGFSGIAVGIGIEKASDAVALVSMGCDCGQGFLLGQPMPEERFGSLLRQRAASQGRQLAAEQAEAARDAAQHA
ncbi:MAG: EAL domain-containing protein [Xanthobacteraceae bacterium]